MATEKQIANFALQQCYGRNISQRVAKDIRVEKDINSPSFTKTTYDVFWRSLPICAVHVDNNYGDMTVGERASTMPDIYADDPRPQPKFKEGDVVLDIRQPISVGSAELVHKCYGKLMGYASGGDPDDTHTPTVIYMKEDGSLDWTWVEWARVVDLDSTTA